MPRRVWKPLHYRTTSECEEITSSFVSVRVMATDAVRNDHLPLRQDWLIIEWPHGEDEPSDYWLSNLGEDENRERLPGSGGCVGRASSTTGSEGGARAG